MSRPRQGPTNIVLRRRSGVVMRYLPSMGSSVRYRVTCPHGQGLNARTLADARSAARDLEQGQCPDCAP